MSDIKFVVFVPTFIAEQYIVRSLMSAITQTYKNFRIICVVDAASDKTLENARTILEAHPEISSQLLFNPTRHGFLANLYYVAYNLCSNDEIIVELDGDDQLAHNNVLQILANIYEDRDVWMTYGSYEYDHESRNPDPLSDPRGIAYPISPLDHTRRNGFRASHLRSFYTWLFRRIDVNDLKFNGEWIDGAADHALTFPMTEMGGPQHCRYIHEILYLYNASNPLNEHKIKPGITRVMVDHIMSRPIYGRLNSASYV